MGIVQQWARLGLSGDREGKGAPYEQARKAKELETHFKKLDSNGDGLLSVIEIQKGTQLRDHASDALAWHDVSGDGAVSLEEFREGFAFWSGVSHEVIQGTPKDLRKFQLQGTLENLEDLPPKFAKKSLKHGLAEEARLIAAEAKGSEL